MRFLVESGTRLGDCAVDVALFRAIVRHGHHLEVIAGDFAAQLLAGCDFINVLHTKKPRSISWPNAQVYWRLSRQEWDVVVTTRFVPMIQIAGLFRHKHRLRATDEIKSLQDQGAVMLKLSILRSLIPDWDRDIDTSIPFAAPIVDSALQFCGLLRGQRYITVAPGGSHVNKRWPVENFAAVIGRLIERQPLPVVAIGTGEEAGLGAQLAETCGAINTAGQISLAQACALVSNSVLHLGNNSGLSHVAAGNRVPTVTVGPPRHCAPWQQPIIADPLVDIAPGQVIEIAEPLLAGC